ncbi:hypothetical protein CHM34_06435 [Paludifilum halophilum]|uniref:Peptidase S1 domain-containing protein n=1 Tax=Paludifilum halophilum TaxID=1642702 RepID=A0A235B8A3_9BACL|nr:hypothetical protein CHM34_06435 [Paludifilum halophilum]
MTAAHCVYDTYNNVAASAIRVSPGRSILMGALGLLRLAGRPTEDAQPDGEGKINYGDVRYDFAVVNTQDSLGWYNNYFIPPPFRC